MDGVLTTGKWLIFDKGTFFGDTKQHFGIIVGIDYEQRIVVIAVNATSQIEKLIRFADMNGIPTNDAMVDVTRDIHFSKPTGLDCHRPQTKPLDLVLSWIEKGKIRKVDYNEDIALEKMKAVVGIMLRSPLIPENVKTIIKNSNQGLM